MKLTPTQEKVTDENYMTNGKMHRIWSKQFLGSTQEEVLEFGENMFV